MPAGAPAWLRLAARAAPPLALDPAGVSLYVHLPFCRRRCRYCDFNAWAWTGQDLAAYVDAVLAEASCRAPAAPQTVFLGGGTPSLLPPELLRRLLDGLHERTGFRDSAREVTMEANPESAGHAVLQAAREGGVDRISLGVQSLQPEVLQAYDRVHDPEQALAALERARTAGFLRRNADLIFAFPGQAPDRWEADLTTVLATGVEHVSCYELSYEPGTPLTRLKEAGRWRAADPDDARRLFDRTRELCAGAGLGGYEVSNFARPGAACLHNLATWRFHEWVGIGAGAASWRGGEHRRNVERPEDYLAAVAAGRDPVAEAERPAPRTLLFDILMMGLRLPAEGVDLDRAAARTGLDPRAALAPALDALLAEGLLELAPVEERTHLRLTPAGLPFLDGILERLLPEPAE